MPATENSNNFWNLGWGDHGTQPLNTAYDAKKRKGSRFRPTKNFGIPQRVSLQIWRIRCASPAQYPCFVGI